jgi:hypothetical protein
LVFTYAVKGGITMNRRGFFGRLTGFAAAIGIGKVVETPTAMLYRDKCDGGSTVNRYVSTDCGRTWAFQKFIDMGGVVSPEEARKAFGLSSPME